MVTQFEQEYPEEAAFLALIYAERPHYHRAKKYHYFPRRWHFTIDGRCLELPHMELAHKR
jgi:hypothetical protein